MNLKENLAKTIEEIEEARLKYSPHHIVKLVAVSKYVQSSDIAELYKLGQRAFGENKIQDLKTKSKELENLPIEWHIIGTLQENKINQLLNLKPSVFQGLDSASLAKKLQNKLEKNDENLTCLLQINISKESTKSGVEKENAVEIYQEILETCPNINLGGIMAIATNTSDIKIIDSCFKQMKDIFDNLQPYGAKILSCGMSGDFKIAIANGANMVRIGSSIFR